MQHTCAVTALGRLVCSGTIAESPVTPPEGVFQAVSSGDWQSCAIDEDGEVRCWGEIYTPSATEVLRAPAPETFPGKFRAVAAGGSLACGIRTDDTLACWGDEVALAGMPDSGTFTSVAVGTMHACAIRTEGTLVCWGFGSEGETDAPAGKFQAISAGNYRTCAVRIDGSIACWGAGDDLPPPAGPFAQVSVGGDPGSYLWYACATRDDGSAECWGKSSSPAGPLDGAFMSLSTGSYQVCAVDLDCVVSCTPRTP